MLTFLHSKSLSFLRRTSCILDHPHPCIVDHEKAARNEQPIFTSVCNFCNFCLVCIFCTLCTFCTFTPFMCCCSMCAIKQSTKSNAKSPQYPWPSKSTTGAPYSQRRMVDMIDTSVWSNSNPQFVHFVQYVNGVLTFPDIINNIPFET